jgi:alanyl-tRNA synthetase
LGHIKEALEFVRPVFGNQLMTERLYYTDSFLYEFEARVVEVCPPSAADPRPAVVLDRTAFYPTSGGQVFDTGWLAAVDPSRGEGRWRVTEVAEGNQGTIKHFFEAEPGLSAELQVRGTIDATRRRDHMQQHSRQHVLSAAFVRLFDLPTVSFHMGDDYCSIDLDGKALSAEQVKAAECLSNDVILENRPVTIRFVSQEEARSLGLRKLPPAEKDELRLIEIRDFDLTACGGTHVRETGQIGGILLRKTEKVRQGIRVEFVCGQRAVQTARRDYTALSEAAGLLSAHLWDVPQQIRKSQEDAKAARKSSEKLLEDLAEQHAIRMLAEKSTAGAGKAMVRVFPDRDLTFIRMLAQKLTRLDTSVLALLGATLGQVSLVFAQSPGQPYDMGALMKESLSQVGGRGGGSRDLAQGGLPASDGVETLLTEVAKKLDSGV